MRRIATTLALMLALAAAPAAAQDVILVVPADAPPPVVIVQPATLEPGEPEAPFLVPIEAPQEIAAEPTPAPAAVPVVVEPPAPREPGPELVSIGLSGLIGLRDDDDSVTPTWTSGFDVGLRLAPWIAVVARRVTFGMADTFAGERWAVGVTPSAELTLPLSTVVQPYVQIGVGLQGRFGGQAGRVIGVAPSLAAGARFFVVDCFSIAAELAAHAPVNEEGFLFGHEVMPQGAILVQTGIALAFHFR